MRRPRIWGLCGLVILVLAMGCTEPGEEPLPSELKNAVSWGEVSFNGTIGEVYTDRPLPTTEYTRVFLYFPYNTPSDASSASVHMNLRLEEAFDPLPDNSLADSSLVLGAPATPILSFNRTNLLYSGILVPYLAGQWTLEFAWKGNDLTIRTYMPITISEGETRRAVVAVATNIEVVMVVLAWLEPPQPIPGTQSYELLAWRSRETTQRFDLDSTLTVQLAIPEGVEPSDTSLAMWETGRYTGTLTFPNSTSWEVNASVLQDTIDIGSAVFQLD